MDVTNIPKPWRLERRDLCYAIVDSNGQDVCHIDDQPRFYNGQPAGSITSRGRTAEQLATIAKLIAAAPRLADLLCEAVEILAMSANNEEETPHDDDLARTCSPDEPAGCLICEARHAIELANTYPTRSQ